MAHDGRLFERRSLLKGAGAVVAGGAIGLAAPPIIAARAATKVRMQIAWLPLGGFTYAFAAKEIGAWEKRGLEVTIARGFGSGNVCLTVNQGQYDFGIIDLAVMMNCVGRALDLVAIAGIWVHSPIGIFSLKEYGLTKPKDLEGQRIAFDVGSGDFQLWPAFVKATGIDDAKVAKVMVDAAALIPVLIDKKIKAEGNFYNSIAPSVWAEGMQLNSILYEEYGIKMLSNSLVATRSTVEKKPELCQAFVEGMLEGLKYSWLHPEKAVDFQIASVKQLREGGPQTHKVVEFGHEIGTALAVAPSVEEHGLGWIDPALAAVTRNTVKTYMNVKELPPADQLFTNRFVGKTNLSPGEWKAVADRSRKFLPSTKA